MILLQDDSNFEKCVFNLFSDMRDSELAARLAMLGWCQVLLVSCTLIVFLYLTILESDLRLISCQLAKLSRQFPTLP
jgi:hypothetical protein